MLPDLNKQVSVNTWDTIRLPSNLYSHYDSTFFSCFRNSHLSHLSNFKILFHSPPLQPSTSPTHAAPLLHLHPEKWKHPHFNARGKSLTDWLTDPLPADSSSLLIACCSLLRGRLDKSVNTFVDLPVRRASVRHTRAATWLFMAGLRLRMKGCAGLVQAGHWTAWLINVWVWSKWDLKMCGYLF